MLTRTFKSMKDEFDDFMRDVISSAIMNLDPKIMTLRIFIEHEDMTHDLFNEDPQGWSTLALKSGTNFRDLFFYLKLPLQSRKELDECFVFEISNDAISDDIDITRVSFVVMMKILLNDEIPTQRTTMLPKILLPEYKDILDYFKVMNVSRFCDEDFPLNWVMYVDPMKLSAKIANRIKIGLAGYRVLNVIRDLRDHANFNLDHIDVEKRELCNEIFSKLISMVNTGPYFVCHNRLRPSEDLIPQGFNNLCKGFLKLVAPETIMKEFVNIGKIPENWTTVKGILPEELKNIDLAAIRYTKWDKITDGSQDQIKQEKYRHWEKERAIIPMNEIGKSNDVTSEENNVNEVHLLSIEKPKSFRKLGTRMSTVNGEKKTSEQKSVNESGKLVAKPSVVKTTSIGNPLTKTVNPESPDLNEKSK